MSESTLVGYYAFFGPGSGIKKFWKTGSGSGVIFIFGSRILRGLYKCDFLSKNIAEFRLHRWLPEYEQESDSQIWQNFGPGSWFKIFATGAESESENVTPATSDGHRSCTHLIRLKHYDVGVEKTRLTFCEMNLLESNLFGFWTTQLELWFLTGDLNRVIVKMIKSR